MAKHFFNRSWTLRLAPIFLDKFPIAGLLSIGIWTGCGDELPENVSLLAKVGEVEITADALRAFEASLAKAEKRSQHRANLRTLVDREVMLLAAGARGLGQDEEVLVELAQRETKALADAMLKRHVEEKAVVAAEGIEKAYAQQGWGEQVITIEMFVQNREQARQVEDLLAQGRDFEAVGRLFAADPYYGVLTGETKRMAYSPFDSPRAVVKAVFALEVGGVTGPIALHGGFVLAKVAERRRAALVEVEDGIRQALGTEKQKQLRQSYLRHLKWDLGTDFNAAGMELVVGVLQGAVVWQTLDEAQRHMTVYAFEGFEMDVEEVLEAVRPSGNLWPKANADAVNEKLAESHFPNKIMAHDARRKGLDKTEVFARSRVAALGNLMLIKLRRLILAQTPEPSEADLAAFYQEHKHRFRSAAWAQLEEILVEDPALARELVTQIEAGAEIPVLAQVHTERRKAKEGVIYVSQSQAPLFGEVWMNAVMNAELNQLMGPIQTKGGYSVFKVVARHAEVYHGLELERVRKSVVRDVREQAEREHFNSQLRALRQKYAERIEVYEDHLQYLDDAAPSAQR